MESLRKPLFIVALALMLIVVLVELGTAGVVGSAIESAGDIGDLVPPSGDLRSAFDGLDASDLSSFDADKPPGLAIRYMVLVDGVLFFTLALIGLSLLIGDRLQARIQGIITLIFSVLIIITAIALILAALAKLLLMIALFLAIPFGTLAYLAIYGFFSRGGASALLGLVMTLKIAFGICLVLAHQRFLENKGLVLIVITSFLGNVIVSFLHGIVPGFLVSVTDALAAIVVGILGVVWAIILLVGAIISVIKALG